jgi:hypothetical protein
MNNLIKLSQYCPRVMANADKKIAMYWSGKAGCSTLAKIFFTYIDMPYDENNPIDTRDDYSRYVKSATDNRSYWCNQDLSFYSDYFRLQLVRNPYSRAISAFLKFLHMNEDKISMSFQMYLETIIAVNSLGGNDNILLEHHMLPQYMINLDQLNYVLKLESLKKDIDCLYKQYNISLFYKENKDESYNKYIKPNINYSAANVVYRFIGNNNSNFFSITHKIFGIPEYKYFYNRYCKNMVDYIYGLDIETFEYSFPYDINVL